MSTPFNEKKFMNLLQITAVVIKIIIIIIVTIIGFLALGFLVTVFLPASLLTIDLNALVDGLTIDMMGIAVTIPGDLFQDEVSLKGTVLTTLTVAAIYMAFFAFLIHLLYGLLMDAKKQTPFSRANIKRLFTMSYALITGGIVLPIFLAVVGWVFIAASGFEGASVEYALHGQYIMTGVLIFILAKLFEYGAYLQDEVDMTV